MVIKTDMDFLNELKKMILYLQVYVALSEYSMVIRRQAKGGGRIFSLWS